MIHLNYKQRQTMKGVFDSPRIRDEICNIISPFAFNQQRYEQNISSANDNHSPVSHGCRTPIKKAKRSPNFAGYPEEHSDEEFRHFCAHHHSQLTSAAQPLATDPLRICLFPVNPDEDINDNYSYSQKSPVKFKFDSSCAED